MKKYLSLSVVAVSLVLLGVGCSKSTSPTTKTIPVENKPVQEVLPSANVQPTENTQPTVNTEAPAEKVAVKIDNFSFEPANLIVNAGTIITWTNDDSAPHTISANDNSFDSGSIAKGGTFSYTFATPGTVEYHCTIHKSMVGSITVVK